jgi:hypothetical protein
MRILLIAPDQPNLESQPEIRLLTELHHTHVLSNGVKVKEIIDAARQNHYDVIHIATHMEAPPESYDTVALSGGARLSLQDMAQVCRLSGGTLCFFNFCAAARFGAYVSKNSPTAAIFTTVYIQDDTAWRLPLEFYTRCQAEEKIVGLMDYREVFESVNDNSGIYAWAASAKYYASLFGPINESIQQLDRRMTEGFAKAEKTITEIGRTVEGHTLILGTTGGFRNRRQLALYVLIGVTGVASVITLWQNVAQWLW